MKIVLGADAQGTNLKNIIKEHLLKKNIEVLDLTNDDKLDFVDSTQRVAKEVLLKKDSLGIVFDAYGEGSFIVATKIKNMIAAIVSEERTAYMTREHNNSRLISIGSEIVGIQLAKNIVDEFIKANYSAGRHQIRIDMLNKMC